MTPYMDVLPLTPNIMVTVTMGDFDGDVRRRLSDAIFAARPT